MHDCSSPCSSAARSASASVAEAHERVDQHVAGLADRLARHLPRILPARAAALAQIALVRGQLAQSRFPAVEVGQATRAQLIDLGVRLAQPFGLAKEDVAAIDGMAADSRKRRERVEQRLHVALAIETLRDVSTAAGDRATAAAPIRRCESDRSAPRRHRPVRSEDGCGAARA